MATLFMTLSNFEGHSSDWNICNRLSAV